MATRAEMRVEIEALAKEQGTDIAPGDLDRMNHTDMTSLLEAFRAQAQTGASDDVEVTEETAGSEELPPAPPPASPLNVPPTETVDGADAKSLGGPPPKGGVKYKWPYTVVEGRSVTTSRRGTLGAFSAVRASDFAGGQAQLDELVAAGFVAKQA